MVSMMPLTMKITQTALISFKKMVIFFLRSQISFIIYFYCRCSTGLQGR